MDLPDLKRLKKLADACRKAGIKTFKGFGFEFTLSDETYKSSKAGGKMTHKTSQHPDAVFESDTLTDEELMMWSVQRPANEESAE